MRWISWIFLGLLVILAGCGGRGSLAVLQEPDPTTETRAVLIASSRQTAPAPLYFSDARAYRTNFTAMQVSIPPDREIGELEYPTNDRIDPDKQFLIASSVPLRNGRDFVDAINAELRTMPKNMQQGSIFVHGFNTNHAEAVLRAVALAEDTGRQGVEVVYSWPSAGSLLKYLDDRESALFARDALYETLVEMSRSRLSNYLVVAHSMGTFVAMDTLRELAQQNATATLDKIRAVVLISADLDIDVFRKQATPVLAAGVPIVLMTTDDDLALGISAKLRGQGDRVGDIRNKSELGGLDIPVFDLSAVTTGDALRHFKIGSSPEILTFLRKLNEKAEGVFDAQTGGRVVNIDAETLQGGTGIVFTQ